MKEWNLDEALDLVRSVNADMKSLGWFAALAGGVLNTGSSEHDLDLVLVPYNETDFDFRTATEYFHGRGWAVVRTPEQMIESWRGKGLRDTKTVMRWRVGEKLVDTIFPSGRKA